MSTLKKEKSPEYIKHPFGKKKLKVLDCFNPPGKSAREKSKPPLTCSVCNSDSINKIFVVESDVSDESRYYVIHCLTCDKYHWYVLGATTAAESPIV